MKLADRDRSLHVRGASELLISHPLFTSECSVCCCQIFRSIALTLLYPSEFSEKGPGSSVKGVVAEYTNKIIAENEGANPKTGQNTGGSKNEKWPNYGKLKEHGDRA